MLPPHYRFLRMLPLLRNLVQIPLFTIGNAKTQITEKTYVSNRELRVPLQFPIGDDVSALNPLRSSVEVLPLANPPSTEDENTNQPRT
jgi:hypothetical protein